MAVRFRQDWKDFNKNTCLPDYKLLEGLRGSRKDYGIPGWTSRFPESPQDSRADCRVPGRTTVFVTE
jgi:hypothetical protein